MHYGVREDLTGGEGVAHHWRKCAKWTRNDFDTVDIDFSAATFWVLAGCVIALFRSLGRHTADGFSAYRKLD